jgi:hypothetical protein
MIMRLVVMRCAGALVLVGTAGAAQAAPWVPCGQLSNLNPTTCQIANRPSTQYEYAIAYNTTEPVPVVCTFWNVGARIANKEPYLIYSDNPPAGMRWGGFVFYQNTAAADDNACIGGYRHQYWRFTTNNLIEVLDTNGCYTTQQVYCRRR